MTAPSHDLLTYDPTGVFLDGTGITRADLEVLSPQLNRARQELVDSAATFVHLPATILSEYRANQRSSDLGRMLRTARRIQDTVDRVVVLGTRGSTIAGRALMDACCDPYFNELSRGQRGSRPRVCFAGDSFDNDATQGLLRLLGEGRRAETVDSRWAMVVIGTDDSALGPAVACRPFLTALQRACGGDASKVAQLVVPVARAGGRMFTLGQSLGCREIFCLPDGLDEGFSVLSAVALLPAALLGLNVVTLLEGAQAMTTHFREARLGENAVLDYVAVCHLTEQKRGATTRVLNVWSKALESFGQWYGHLLAGSLRPYRGGATPITLSTNLIVERWRCDPLSVGNIGFDLDKRDLIADRTLPEIMAAAIQAANAANRADRLLTADLRLPQLNEFALGQLFQMLMLATLMEDWKTA